MATSFIGRVLLLGFYFPLLVEVKIYSRQGRLQRRNRLSAHSKTELMKENCAIRRCEEVVKSGRKNSKRSKKRERPRVAPTSSAATSWRDHWVALLLIAVATVSAFFPALRNGFVNWDDNQTLVENAYYRGLGLNELRWMFTTFHMGHYQPLSWMTFGMDYLVWGMNPFGYHLTNLILHSANAVLFYFITLRLLRAAHFAAVTTESFGLRLAAGLAALVFAIHPLRVESVAWLTERRDVLSGFFLFWTVLCYLHAAQFQQAGRNHRRWIVAAVIFYFFSLLSKASGVTLPIVLLVLDVYPLRRLAASPGKWFKAAAPVWSEKIPFVILALAAGVIAPIAQYEIGALKLLNQYGLMPRLAQALFGLAFYVWKTFVPLSLSPLYQTPTLLWRDWPFVLSVIFVAVISIGFFMLRRSWPAGLAVWVSYAVILAPVLGIFQSGVQYVADRYSYLACSGWAMLAGGGLFWLWQAAAKERVIRRIFMPVTLAAGVVVVGLGILTWRQTRIWHDSETLWRYALADNQRSYFISSVAHYNLANALIELNKTQEGIEQFRLALEIEPDYASAHYNLGNALYRQRSFEEAAEHYRETVKINPNHVKARTGLGNALAAMGKLNEARQEYQEAIRMRSDLVEPHFNLAFVLVLQGQLDEAIKQYQQALALSPADSQIYYNLGNVFLAQGRIDEALDHFYRALTLRPGYAEVYASLRKAFQAKREKDIEQRKEAIAILNARRAAHGSAK